MKIEIIRVGNSRGIRIPKPLIEQCGLGDTVELRVEDDRLIILPERSARQGWEKAFAAAGSASHDEVLLEGAEANAFDRKEWRW